MKFYGCKYTIFPKICCIFAALIINSIFKAMPTIYKYIGIIIRFFSDEHEPVHVHAEYDGAVVKISLFVKNGKIYRITYSAVSGSFNASKLADLKKFIALNKYSILYAWEQYFNNNVAIKPITITKRIK